jgi:hypothetical protein
MKRYLLWILVVIVVVGVAYEVLVKWNALPCNYQYVEYRHTYPEDEDTLHQVEWTVSYPIFMRRIYTDEGVEHINSMVEDVAVQDTVSIEDLSVGFVASYKDFKASMMSGRDIDEDLIPGWYYDSKTYVLINGSKLIVTECEIDEYQGGAHGTYGSFFANYDVKTGRKLALDDVFTDTVVVSEAVTKYFVEQYELERDVPLSRQGFFVDEHRLPVTPNFALLPEGVLFTYNIYEIAPYAFGKCEVTVPYSALRAVMKYRPDFRKADVLRHEIVPE